MLDGQKHYPADPDRFQFDGEVAKIFPNMAERSIPNYREMHSMHARILARRISLYNEVGFSNEPFSILDIGASRCDFFKTLRAHVTGEQWGSLSLTASDASQAMIDETKAADSFLDFENINYVRYDLGDLDDRLFDGRKFNCVVMHYVMQFVPQPHRRLAFERLGRLVKSGGILLYGEKNCLMNREIQEAMHQHYVSWRRQMGYSLAEIEAKTHALKNSMWESVRQQTDKDLMAVGFGPTIVTTCTGLFRSFIAHRIHE